MKIEALLFCGPHKLRPYLFAPLLTFEFDMMALGE